MDQPRITVEKTSYVLPTQITGTDEQGRTTLICPQCCGPAHAEEDGRIVCHDWAPVQDAVTKLLADAYDRLIAQVQA